MGPKQLLGIVRRLATASVLVIDDRAETRDLPGNTLAGHGLDAAEREQMSEQVVPVLAKDAMAPTDIERLLSGHLEALRRHRAQKARWM